MTATKQPDRSPAPGIIPEPVRVHHENALTAATKQQDESRPKRRNPVKVIAAAAMSALRGDKHMVNAYPAAEPNDAAAADAGSRPGKS